MTTGASTGTEWDDAEDVVTAECALCRTVRPCKWSSDPYAEDVHGEVTPPQWWCKPCYQSACDDI